MLEPQLGALAQDDVWLATAVGDIDAVRAQIADGLDVTHAIQKAAARCSPSPRCSATWNSSRC